MRPTQSMPTAGKFVSAIGLAGLMWYGTVIVKAIWPVEESFGMFSPFVAAVGLVMGWRVTGTRLGRGYMAGAGAGLTGLFAALFWVFLLLSFNEMIGRALDLRYKGPVEAIVAMFGIAMEYAANVYYWPLIGILAIGALAVGLVAEFVAHRWA